MQYLGIEYSIKNLPALDADFIPFGVWAKAYLKEAARPFKIAVERENGLVSVFETKLRSSEFAEANVRFVERFVKMLLWSVGGWRVYLCGDDAVAKQMQDAYRAGGKREFDVGFMQDVYERPFEIVVSDETHFPAAHEQTKKAGGHTNGCRIGFDAGGSDRKVSAVVDGETVYSEEVVWHPKTSENPQYQYDGIVTAFKTAASKMPRVDGIGVSSAGVFIQIDRRKGKLAEPAKQITVGVDIAYGFTRAHGKTHDRAFMQTHRACKRGHVAVVGNDDGHVSDLLRGTFEDGLDLFAATARHLEEDGGNHRRVADEHACG